MQYALGTKDAATQPYTTSIPTATNAGTYYVWYKVIGDENHKDAQAGCVEVIIKSRAAYQPSAPASARTVTSETRARPAFPARSPVSFACPAQQNKKAARYTSGGLSCGCVIPRALAGGWTPLPPCRPPCGRRW